MMFSRYLNDYKNNINICLLFGNILNQFTISLGSPYIVKIAGEPSGKMTGEYTSQRHATDTTHIGSECELSLKIPGI